MQPDYAQNIGRSEPNRRGEIVDRRAGLAGIELRASAIAQIESRVRLQANGRGGIRDCLIHVPMLALIKCAQPRRP
jgi:hypothetical protein